MAKAESALRPFGGQEDLEECWQKFQVVGKIQKWTTAKDRMAHLPLYLAGDAFTVWRQIEESDQEDEDKVKARLEESFACSAREAYSQFVRRRKRDDETVDIYVSDLRRLLTLSGHKEAADGKDPVLVEQFLTGLPRHFSSQLRLSAASSAADPTLSQLTKQARALFAAVDEPVATAFTAAVVGSEESRVCYSCSATGHLRRDCPRKKKVQCFKCKQFGHIKRNCPAVVAKSQEQSNVRTSASASVVSADTAGKTKDVCLGLVARSRGSLPKVFVSVAGGQEKWIAAIDSCSSRSLVSLATARALSLVLEDPADVDAITAIDGESLKVSGVAELTVSRVDSKVYLPEITTKFLVVASLDVVQSDLLIGLDVISSAGGIALEYSETDGRLTGAVFGSRPVVAAAEGGPTSGVTEEPLPPHIQVRQDGDKVTLAMSDCEVAFDAEEGFWEVSWRWQDGAAPTFPLGSGIGEYSRQKLSDDQESKFVQEVQNWVNQKWLVPYDESQHGKMGCVLLLLAVCQEHKESTPIRPCLDYRELNSSIVSQPGLDAPACEEKLRKWRQCSNDMNLLDIRKAFLNVHVHPDLQRFQVVIWKGRKYVMQRMGFGLSIAPKVMDAVVRWVTKDFPATDNYVDDILTPQDQTEKLAAALQQYGLPTKPPVKLEEACVLGLKIGTKGSQLLWDRRDQAPNDIPAELTKRSIFRWCGALTTHYPVCCWLHPMSSWLRRLASLTESWDVPVPDGLQDLCRDVMARLLKEDPVHGTWSVPNRVGQTWKVWCDASSIAYGVALEVDSAVVEDQCWLRQKNDKRHINLSELEVVIKGLNLAVKWNASNVKLLTDSKTVYGWLRSLLGDLKRIKVSGLNEVVVHRRLQTIADLIRTTHIAIDLEWVPSATNKADELTRVPEKFVQYWRSQVGVDESEVTISAAAPLTMPGSVTREEIKTAQEEEEQIAQTIAELQDGREVTVEKYKKFRTQLTILGGVLMRSIKVPPSDVKVVPVIPEALEHRLLAAAHSVTGHGGWQATWQYLRMSCFMLDMASKCQQFVASCASCAAANPRRGPTVLPSRPEILNGPWSTVVIDTLDIRTGGTCQSVLICVDAFSKWAEVIPLRRHDPSLLHELLYPYVCDGDRQMWSVATTGRNWSTLSPMPYTKGLVS